ncbi:thiopeptide-type bacteriocin biosynthesis protein [Streptomyces sp. NPDC059477]|uniref:thiopeptide-type bacteriocin biosynthesis protein n=1 Tax=Streptomyces sp. NPDC059477 TaxID=3346847 RepID=UPI0036C510B7
MIPLDRFLADCLLDAREAEPGSDGSVPLSADRAGYREARRRFLTAGLTALHADHVGAGWVQMNITPTAQTFPAIYARLDEIASEALNSGLATNFFFMHKPPGMRVRFQAPTPQGRAELQHLVTRRMAAHPEIFGIPQHGVYEPESYLFGGPEALPWVHTLFTADSLAWLHHHADPPTAALTDWRYSLTLLRDLLDGLGIIGWEHRGVWETLQREAGRDLGEAARQSGVSRAMAGIQHLWRLDHARLTSHLPEPLRTSVDLHRAAIHRAALSWRTDHFDSGAAEVTGPRRAAAYCVIFHWNRARFSAALQKLLTRALVSEGGHTQEASGAAPRTDHQAVG